jgi:hypothetical protein
MIGSETSAGGERHWLWILPPQVLILMEDTRDDVRLLAEHVATALDRIQRYP